MALVVVRSDSGAMMPDDAAHFIRIDFGATDRQSNVMSPEARSADQIGPATVLAVLRALASMARISRRHEADVGSALHGAGLRLEPEECDAALRHLLKAECIERIIPLTDGGILVSVTAIGMSRSVHPG